MRGLPVERARSDASRGQLTRLSGRPLGRETISSISPSSTLPGRRSGMLKRSNVPQRGDAIAPRDLLALVVVAAVVGDRLLVDAAAQPRDLRRDLRLEPEPVRLDLDLPQHLAAEDLVAGLHVGEVQVRAPRSRASVRSLLPTKCQKLRTRCGPPRNREPKTTSASPSSIGTRRLGMSRGSYSRSASWMTTTSPRACVMPVRTRRALAAIALCGRRRAPRRPRHGAGCRACRRASRRRRR